MFSPNYRNAPDNPPLKVLISGLPESETVQVLMCQRSRSVISPSTLNVEESLRSLAGLCRLCGRGRTRNCGRCRLQYLGV